MNLVVEYQSVIQVAVLLMGCIYDVMRFWLVFKLVISCSLDRSTFHLIRQPLTEHDQRYEV
jgi:hypothetical protein